MRVVVTRPEVDAITTAKFLREIGHIPIIESLLRIETVDNKYPIQSSYQAIIFTSANGVRSAIATDVSRNIKYANVVVVGEASAQEARDSGFTNIIVAEGDLVSLRKIVLANLDPVKGRLLYITGDIVSGDLRSILSKDGFVIERLVLYEAIAAKSLSQNFITEIDNIDNNEEICVTLFSPRSASIWAELIIASERVEAVIRMRHLCLSANVAAILQKRLGISPSNIIIPDKISQAELLKLI